MQYNLWGTPDEAKPLSPSITRLLETMLGASSADVTRIPAEQIQLSDIALSAQDLEGLGAIVGADFVSTERSQRMPRSRGKSYLDLLDWRADSVIDAPDAVVAPHTDEEITELLQFCAQHSIAVVPFGGGTSVVGGVQPLRGPHRAVISLDLARFDTLTDIDTESGLATLGAGLTGPHAEMLLAEHGLQLGHFPQSFPYATIGGFAVTRSSGQNSSGYGRFDDMVHSLRVVTPSGPLDVGRVPASAAGPDLRELFLGSEGAFGIVTRVRLRVHPIPAVKRYEAFSFPDFETGVAAVRKVVQTGAQPTVIRQSDKIESSINLAGGDDIGNTEDAPTGCLAITMFEGSGEHSALRHQETRDLMLAAGGVSLGEAPARAWEQGRFSAPVLRDGLLDNGALCETLETATDWSNVAQLRRAVGEALAAELSAESMALVMCHVSHVYTAGCSLYFTIVSGQGAHPHERWKAAKSAVCRAILDNGGTISHHHGVGIDHAAFMRGEIGELGVSILVAIKREVDPHGILNPGKLLGPGSIAAQ